MTSGIEMTRGGYVALHVVPAALLVVAVASMPYGYYTLLRFVVCLSAVWLAVLDFQRAKNVGAWIVALAVVAITFNPLLPIYLSRKIWIVPDLAAAALFGAHFWATRRGAVS